MPKRTRPRGIPLVVLITSVCFFARAHAQVNSPPSSQISTTNQTNPATPLSLSEALRLANAQASSYQTAILNERIAAEDVRQAQAAFKPRISAPLGYIYTSPAIGLPPGEPRVQSFIANDAIGAYEAFVSVSGDFDVAGRMRATVAKNRALLAAAHAGTQVARLALNQAVIESYYGLALANAQNRAASETLASAEEFERITSLLLSGGEVAAVDLTRAHLQTLRRQDELERAKVNEEIAAGALRVLVGYEFSQPVNTTDLVLAIPTKSEYQQFRAGDVSRRPEFTQLEQELRAAQLDIKIARAERLPSLSYLVNGGFNTDSVRAPRLKEHSGISAGISLNIPIFDWGASKSREEQARLRADLTKNERTLALRGFSQQFYAARAQAASAASRINLTKEGVDNAQDNLSASIARYRAGEAQIVEVTEAQTTLVEQRSALYQAIFDYQTALARLRQVTGQ